MKISKIAIVALFAAGFLTTAASPSMATDCLNGNYVDLAQDGESIPACESIEPTEENVDVKPIDSCWTTEDGTDVCARGLMEPMLANGEEVPVDGVDVVACEPGTSGIVDSEGKTPEECWYDAVPYEATGEEGEGGIPEEGAVDETLMYQSGVTKSGATPNDQTASSTLAAFGVLVGALGALGIAISRQKEAK